MEDILEKIVSLGITVDSNTALEIAKIWFYVQVVRFGSLIVVMGGLFLGIFTCVKKAMISDGCWK